MPITPSDVAAIVSAYDAAPIVAAVGSHSALDIADGASSEGFRTLVLAQKGRERTYSQYYRTRRDAAGRPVRGCVDEVWTYTRFADLAQADQQARLRAASALLVPNRALSSYVDLSVLENDLRVPIVGSRSLLRIEERTERDNYYSLLEHAGIPTPTAVPDAASIDGLAIVKLPHATKRLERGFFTVASLGEFQRKRDELLRRGTITQTDLDAARIERYILGPVFNFNFFYSALAPRDEALELLGVDERRESSLDGLVRLPASQQLELAEAGRIPEYTVVGHGTLTVRESILEEVFALGEKFVVAARNRYPPGILGPFCLQTCIDPDGRPWVFDVAVRIGGGTNIHLGLGHPYGNALWRGPMSSGRRIAREIRRALDDHRLGEIVT
jgi:5-formaminoimidazole-4-carboxamide-1-(beta)-D-ribofuranosyl 5'-monophosphate synthetase